MKLPNHNPLLFLTLITLLVVGFAVQSYQVIRLNQKISELETADSDSPLSAIPATQPFAPWGFGPGSDPFTSMQQQMDSLFGAMLQGGNALPGASLRVAATPSIEVSETEKEYRVSIDVPENGELELSTDIEGDTVRVAGSIVYAPPDNPGSYASAFSSRSQFSRSIPLAKPVDPLAMRTDKSKEGFVITIPKA